MNSDIETSRVAAETLSRLDTSILALGLNTDTNSIEKLRDIDVSEIVNIRFRPSSVGCHSENYVAFLKNGDHFTASYFVKGSLQGQILVYKRVGGFEVILNDSWYSLLKMLYERQYAL